MVEAKRHAGGAQTEYLMVGGGPGAYVGAVHKSACDLLGQARLVGGCFSQSFEKTQEQGRLWGLDKNRVYKTYEEMFKAEAARADKPDFVIIVTPNNTHFPVAKLALQNGFHVSCDKPLCLTQAEGEELAKLTREKKLEFLVTYTYLGYPLVRQAREMVKRGDLGDLRLVAAEYLQDWLSDEAKGSKQAAWRVDPKRSGAAGCAGDIGTHAESVAHYLTGQGIASLSAKLDTFVKGRQLDDNCFVWYKTKDGISGSIWASQVAMGRENGLSVRIYGTKGGLEWHQENPNHLLFFPKGQPGQILTRAQGYMHPHAGRYTNLPTGHPEGLFEAFRNLYDGFVTTILARREGKEPGEYDWYPNVEDGVRGMKFIAAAVDSSRKGGAWMDIGS